METEGNKQKVRRLYEEGFNSQNLAVVEEVVADDVVYRNPIAGWVLCGDEAIEEMKQEIKDHDGNFTVLEQIAEGVSVATRYMLEQSWERVTLTHFAAGKIQEYILFAEEHRGRAHN